MLKGTFTLPFTLCTHLCFLPLILLIGPIYAVKYVCLVSIWTHDVGMSSTLAVKIWDLNSEHYSRELFSFNPCFANKILYHNVNQTQLQEQPSPHPPPPFLFHRLMESFHLRDQAWLNVGVTKEPWERDREEQMTGSFTGDRHTPVTRLLWDFPVGHVQIQSWAATSFSYWECAFANQILWAMGLET